MLTSGTDSKNPIYLVTPAGALVTDASGAPVLFTGKANTSHPSGYATDASGNFLMRADRTYIPCAEAAKAGVRATTSDELATQPLRTRRAPSEDELETRPIRLDRSPSPDELATQPLRVMDKPKEKKAAAAPAPSRPSPKDDADGAPPRRRSAMRRVAPPPDTEALPRPAAAEPERRSTRRSRKQAPHRAASAPTPAQPESHQPGALDIASVLPARRLESAELAIRKTDSTALGGDDRDSRWSGLRWPAFVLGGLAVIGLGMGGAWAVDHFLNGADEAASPAQSAPPATEPSEPAAPTQESTPRETIQVPSEAYPGAGEPTLPAGAWQTGDASGNFDWRAPSGNIRCKADGTRDELRCQIASWQKDKPAGNAPGTDKAADTVVLGADGKPSLAATGGEIGKVDAVLLYNTTVYDAKKNWACGAKENGITCWSLKSGHGFVIRRAGILEF